MKQPLIRERQAISKKRVKWFELFKDSRLRPVSRPVVWLFMSGTRWPARIARRNVTSHPHHYFAESRQMPDFSSETDQTRVIDAVS